MVIEANATLICSNAKFIYDGHVSRDVEIVLDDGVESRRGGRRDIATGIITIGVCGERWGCCGIGVAGVWGGVWRGEAIWR